MHSYCWSIYGAIEAKHLTTDARTSTLYLSRSEKSRTSLISFPCSNTHARCCCNSLSAIEDLIFPSTDSKSVQVNALGTGPLEGHSLHYCCWTVGYDGLQGSQRFVFSTGAKLDAFPSLLNFCIRILPNATSRSQPEQSIVPSCPPMAFQSDSDISHLSSSKSFIIIASLSF